MAKSSANKGKTLVIVESPAKSKTIKKILGNDYLIEASYGHIRDLPPKGLGFDVDNDFKPTFAIIPEKQKVVDNLNKIAKTADKIYLASDPDREGEAIAWHVKEVLKVPEDKIFRIEFNEITPKAIKDAVQNFRQIDMLKVKAQQTRQILDRLVGFKISPILWEKLRNYRLSAGRVQSVALRMIVEREEEIEAFVPVEYWTIGAVLSKNNYEFEAELTKYKDKKIEIKNKEEALVKSLTDSYVSITEEIARLKESIQDAATMEDMQKAADFCHCELLSKMEALRLAANSAEELIPDSMLPYPTYDQLLFSL